MAKNDKMEVQKEAKLKALDEAIAHIEKQYGKALISRWDLAVCQEDVSLRCTDRNPVVRLP